LIVPEFTTSPEKLIEWLELRFTVPEFVVVPLKTARDAFVVKVPAFAVVPFTVKEPPGFKVNVEPLPMSSVLTVVVAVTFVLVEAGMVTSSAEVGVWPQDQFPDVLKSLVPTLAKVQEAAWAVCGSARTRESPRAARPARSQVGMTRMVAVS
jgi:hypothetical protein